MEFVKDCGKVLLDYADSSIRNLDLHETAAGGRGPGVSETADAVPTPSLGSDEPFPRLRFRESTPQEEDRRVPMIARRAPMNSKVCAGRGDRGPWSR